VPKIEIDVDMAEQTNAHLFEIVVQALSTHHGAFVPS
jgi:hypothetical protein